MLKAIKEFFTGKKSEHLQPELSAPVPYKVEAPVTAESAKVETVIAPVAATDVPIGIEAVVATPVAKVATSVPAKKTTAPSKPAPAKKPALAKKPAVPAITSTPKTSKKKK